MWTDHLRFRAHRRDEAFRRAPWGSWAQRWLPGVCRHQHVRCTHGDEIVHRRYRRRVCLDCGASLRGDLPELCFFTGTPHTPTSPR